MSGKKAGVATLVKLLKRKMVDSYCYGHALSLAVEVVRFKVTILKEAFEICREVIKLVKDSPQRDTKLRLLDQKKVTRKRVYMRSVRRDGLLEGKL